MNVVLLTGPAQSGKSTLAKYLCKEGYCIAKFAGPLKTICRHLDLSPEEIDGDLKEQPIDWLGGVTPRHIQQTLGTDWGRDMIHPDIWVKLAERYVLKSYEHNPDLVGFVFDDTRFQNEIDIFKNNPKIKTRVINIVPAYEGYVPIQASGHASETQQLTWDYRILNSGSLDNLRTKKELIF